MYLHYHLVSGRLNALDVKRHLHWNLYWQFVTVIAHQKCGVERQRGRVEMWSGGRVEGGWWSSGGGKGGEGGVERWYLPPKWNPEDFVLLTCKAMFLSTAASWISSTARPTWGVTDNHMEVIWPAQMTRPNPYSKGGHAKVTWQLHESHMKNDWRPGHTNFINVGIHHIMEQDRFFDLIWITPQIQSATWLRHNSHMSVNDMLIVNDTWPHQ